MWTTTVAFPAYYLLKNRNNIYKGSKIVKEFYLKEVLARTTLGFFVGIVLSVYLYGP